ncbi:MAG: hypothetical protein AAGB46_19765, partial [Verrucomicrobiota bacterium]
FAVADDTLIIGAFGDDDDGGDSGTVAVYSAPSIIAAPLALAANGPGTVMRIPNRSTYAVGERLALVANPIGSTFEGWSGDVTSLEDILVLDVGSDPFTVTASFSLPVIVPSEDSYSSWISDYFPGADAEVLAPEADPDGDTVPNLFEFLLLPLDGSIGDLDGFVGTDPRVPSEFEVIIETTPAVGGAITIEIKVARRKGSGLLDSWRLGAEASSTLSDWSGATIEEVDIVSLSDRFERVTFRIQVSDPSVFLRLVGIEDISEL